MVKTDYKSKVLDYLKENIDEDVKREVLIKDIGISKSRLSEILNSIRDDGYTITAPPRSGIVKLESSNQTILSAIKDSDLRQWLIIFILSRYGALSFRELVQITLSIKESEKDYNLKLDNKRVYDDSHIIKSIRFDSSSNIVDEDDINVASDYISVTTLRKDLAILRDDGFVTIKKGQKTTYALTSKAPYIITTSGDSLSEFCQSHEEYLSTTSELLPVKQVYNKIQKLISWDSALYEQRKFGKLNQITQAQIDKFNDFTSHPYKTNQLTLHSAFNGIEKKETISVGLLFYSVETSAFYTLCYNHTQERIESRRIDYIDTITDGKSKNTIFHSQHYYQIYNEMFGAGFSPNVYHVKVLIQNHGNVVQRFNNLANIRNATMRKIDNPPSNCDYSYVYEDNIRGLDDFARVLRSSGYSVLAVEPIELKEKLQRTYTWLLDKYEEMNDKNG